MKKYFLSIIILFFIVLIPFEVKADSIPYSQITGQYIYELCCNKVGAPMTNITYNSNQIRNAMNKSTYYTPPVVSDDSLNYAIFSDKFSDNLYQFYVVSIPKNVVSDEDTEKFCVENSYSKISHNFVYSSSDKAVYALGYDDNGQIQLYSFIAMKIAVANRNSSGEWSVSGTSSNSWGSVRFYSYSLDILYLSYESGEFSFEDSVFDDSLGKLNIKTSRYLNTSTHIYHDFFTIDTITSTDVDVTQPGYGIKCQVLFYGDNDYLYDTEYFNLTDYRFNYDWKSKTFENLSLPSLPEPDKFSQYRIFLFPYKEENGTIKRGSFSSVSYGDYVSGVSTSNTREVGVHRVGVTRPDGSTKELDSFVKPLPVISGKGLTLSDKDTINNKYVYEYHYPDEPDEITNNYISNNITNPDSIVDIPGNENVSDFDFGSIKAFLTGLYNFLFKLSKVIILWLGLPPFLATVLNLGLYVIVFLIFGSLFKKLF